MKKSPELAEKVYQVLKNTVEEVEEFAELGYWKKHLKKHGIIETPSQKMLMILNQSEPDDFVYVIDPWYVVWDLEGAPVLKMPTQIAEKIAVLQCVP